TADAGGGRVLAPRRLGRRLRKDPPAPTGPLPSPTASVRAVGLGRGCSYLQEASVAGADLTDRAEEHAQGGQLLLTGRRSRGRPCVEGALGVGGGVRAGGRAVDRGP